MYWRKKTTRWMIILTALVGGLAMSVTVHAATADEQFAKLRDKYFLRTLQLNPVTSSYLGGDGYSKKLKDINGKLRNYGADALADAVRLALLRPGLLCPVAGAGHDCTRLLSRRVLTRTLSVRLKQ